MKSFDLDDAWRRGTEKVIHGENGIDISIKEGITFVKKVANEYEKSLEEKRLGKKVEQKTTEERS